MVTYGVEEFVVHLYIWYGLCVGSLLVPPLSNLRTLKGVMRCLIDIHFKLMVGLRDVPNF
jgi:hypothetical protein